ncbi:MAG: hypothetical protein KGI79_02200 [Patescibacteria group bacterium]|nr:hypothetical protein [Patescibacteria group bacterium]MDE2116663.1 hypothetical protein [Patescibacteria group bacterium]
MSRHKHILRELAKFASGLVVADFLVALWLRSAGLQPIDFLGVLWTGGALIAWMIVDVILFLILVHYAWHAEVHAPSIRQRSYFIIVGIITGVVAIAHLLRIIFGAGIDVSGWAVPLWLSWIGIIVAGFVSYASFAFASKKN